MTEIIRTANELCTGCNRCVRECPMETANVTYLGEAGSIKVRVDPDRCIACGRCFSVCKHDARQYADDTDRFFCDLSAGVPISVIAAPSIRTNIPAYERLFTYLRRLGVRGLHNVSLGADICVWAHVRLIGRGGATPMITQPCPAVVNYCLRHNQGLLPRLSPVQSPMACASIYMKRYMGVTDRIAALSPCLAKKGEFEETGLADYNVTFAKLLRYLESVGAEMPDEGTGFDEDGSGLGSLFPMPGGLRENVEFFVGGRLHMATAEGRELYEKLGRYSELPDEFLPDVYDVLNCAEGCNLGTAGTRGVCAFEAGKAMDRGRRAVRKRGSRAHYESVQKKYDETLDIRFFLREYGRPAAIAADVGDAEIEGAYRLLGKDTYERQHVDCGACGSNTCHGMARKIALKVNIPENCVFKTKEDAKAEHDRILAMERTREADERMRVMLDATPLCVTLMDRDGRVIDCNEEVVRFFRLRDKKEYMERFPLLSPEFQPDGRASAGMVGELVGRAFESGRETFEWTHRLLDGTPLPTEISLVRVTYGGERVIAVFARDLREHVRMMDAIGYRDRLLGTVNLATTMLLQADAEDFEAALWNSMGMMARAVDVDRVYMWKNHTVDGKLYCTQLYEWSEGAEPQQGNEYTIDIPYDENMPGWEGRFLANECVNGAVAGMSPEERAQLAPQGIVSILVVPIFIHESLWGFLGFDDCRNERVFTENEETILRSGSLLLANALMRRDMTRALEASLEKAQAGSRAKSEFLANMSHEIRTPMNAIIGMTSIAKSSDSAERKDYAIGRIGEASVHLLGVINDILDMSKIEAGKLDLNPVPFNFEDMLRKAVDIINFKVAEKGHSLTVSIDEAIPRTIVCDDHRLSQVIANLLSNAVKFTPDGGAVGVEARLAGGGDGRVRIAISVSDTGVGISEGQVARIFGAFEQAESSTTRKYGGTGLGLVISKRIVELMEGSIEVRSVPGEGSTFTVTVMAAVPDGGPDREDPSAARKAAGDVRVLI
ncbi:MAG: ATP-binding protein, partial [Oscillospiraceae bacterium]|nr:ATP-binding protein [Oscillospiraceae bacterium]